MLKSIIKFARIRIVTTCFALIFLGSVYAGHLNLKTFLAFILIVAFTVHANSINDYTDREIDKINLKKAVDRPLVSKDLSLQQFWIIHITSGLIMLLLSLLYGKWAIIISIAIIIIDYLYSLKPVRITDRTILSPLLLSISYVYYSFSLGFLSINTSASRGYPWLLTAGLCLGFVARLLLKDFRDIKGDKKFGKKTFLLIYGSKITCITSGLFWLLAMVVISASISFAPGVVLALIVGCVMTYFWLRELSTTKKISNQEELVAVIAKAANFAIITILAYLLCKQHVGL
jgi:4-hydroxybenzoate polyprenyltransferase